MFSEPTIFERSRPGRHSNAVPVPDGADITAFLPAESLRAELPLPEVSEIDTVRHFTRLSQTNFGIDLGFYPLGSCTMKYNPRVHERVAAMPGFADIHPYQAPATCQGALRVMYELQGYLAEIGGMDAVTLQPVAGAQGEMTGLLLIRAYHRSRGDDGRTEMLVPDSAHGTNPATASLVGMSIVKVPSNARGRVDVEAVKAKVGPRTAGMMMTNPNTLGLFEDQIAEIAEVVHAAGGLMYGDGANLNAIIGVARPGDMGFDVMHFNLHKTFTTPHGGGGPGAGPVAVKAILEPFLPSPTVARAADGTYGWAGDRPQTIGRLHSFNGNFGILVRAYTYIRTLGPEGLRGVAENAVLNANYVRVGVAEKFQIAYPEACMHEFVASAQEQKKTTGVRALDVGKRLMDYGYHPPTVYFPLIVPEAMMIEPTETETRETLDEFVAAMQSIADEDPELVKSAPHTMPVKRVDEVGAAKNLNIRWEPSK
ncbi:MAG TPA: aminomethyl-transferring glycine dehydrogenase subunit GcvPB [Armatimonadota bacterium]|jgi:glycine dehydrogenase subunit 2